jgi:hypothetical protein
MVQALKPGFVRMPSGRQARILGKAHLNYIDNLRIGSIDRVNIIKKFEDKLLKLTLQKTRQTPNKKISKQKIVQKLDIKLDFKKDLYENIQENPIIDQFHKNINKIYKDAHKALYSDSNVISANINMQYVAEIIDNDKKGFNLFIKRLGNGDKIYVKYTTNQPFRKVLNEDTKNPPSPLGNSEFNFRFIGYNISFQTKNNRISKKTIYDLKAYHPSSNRKFHTLCSASTTQDKICIYETFLHNENILKLTYKSKKHKKQLQEKFNQEDENIKTAITKGLLIKSLELLTKKYNTKTLVKFYNDISKDLIIDNGVTIEDYNDTELEQFINKDVFHYEKNVHVAPIKYTGKHKTDNKNNNICTYAMRPERLKKKPTKSNNILSFSIDYILDSNNNKQINIINLYGWINGKHINEEYKTVNEFIDKINMITTVINGSKTRTTKKIENIFMYGFDNSKDDNIFIYKELYKNDPCTKYCFSGNTIKHMKYRNMYIYDLKLFYNSDIEETYVDFGFYNDENIKKHEMIYYVSEKHLYLSTGMINRKYFNFTKSSTISGLGKKSITQTFLKHIVKGSPVEIQKIERLSLFGGKNDIFKKKFISKTKNLYVYDINSAHPFNMKGLMPYKFESMFNDIGFIEMDKFVNYYLYYVKAEHKKEVSFIPNLLTRNKKAVNSLNNCEGWYWGSELNEAIKNNYMIKVDKIIRYEGKEIFNDFINYYSNKKIESKKKGNMAEYKYSKNILNNVIGKFSQKEFNVSSVVKDMDEMLYVLDGDISNSISDKTIGDFTIVEHKRKEDNFNTIGSLCRISSYVTAGTRNQLSKTMRLIGHKHIYYCATDSIFTDKKIPDKYIDKYELGKWNLEKVCNEAYFIGCGSYYVNDINTGVHNKCKAFNKKDIMIEDYKNLINDNDMEITKQFTVNYRDLNNVKVINQDRNLRTNYNKRIFNNNKSTAYDNIDEWINI